MSKKCRTTSLSNPTNFSLSRLILSTILKTTPKSKAVSKIKATPKSIAFLKRTNSRLTVGSGFDPDFSTRSGLNTRSGFSP